MSDAPDRVEGTVFAPEILLLTTTPTELEVLRNQKTKKGNIARNELLYCLRERERSKYFNSFCSADEDRAIPFPTPHNSRVNIRRKRKKRGGGGEVCSPTKHTKLIIFSLGANENTRKN